MNLQLDTSILDKLQYNRFNYVTSVPSCLTIHRDSDGEIDYYSVDIPDFYKVANGEDVGG